MAVIDLSADKHASFIHAAAGVGTAWQEIQLSPLATRVTVYAADAYYVGLAGDAETPVHNAAVGTHFMPVAAAGYYTFELRYPQPQGGPPQLTRASSIFVASQSGTTTVRIHVESGY